MKTPRPLVLVSWNGRDAALNFIHVDAPAQFDWLIFDYSGQGRPPVLPEGVHDPTVLSRATACKGEIYRELATWLAKRPDAPGTPQVPPFVGLIDDDVILSVSGINRLLHVGRVAALHAFSAALTHDSHRSHRWMLKRGERLVREVDWVEVMMPFYAGELFMALAPHLGNNVSSWGIDRYLVPAVQKITQLDRCAIVDGVTASHWRPVTSGQGAFANGLTAAQEAQILKQRAIELLRSHKPELLGTEWFKRIYARRHAQSRLTMAVEGLGRPLRRWLDRST